MYKITKICPNCWHEVVYKGMFSDSINSEIISCKCGMDIKFINLKRIK